MTDQPASETPRTDAAAYKGDGWADKLVSLSCQFERELAQASAELTSEREKVRVVTEAMAVARDALRLCGATPAITRALSAIDKALAATKEQA